MSADSDALLTAARQLADAGRHAFAARLRADLDLRTRLAHALLAGPGPARADSAQIRVAAILDEFSVGSFASVFQATHLHPDTWRAQFEAADPQIFFCESAWSGADSRLRPWKGRIYASSNFPKENRGVLLEILAHCRARGIPTVFWNKEDPTHYPDRIHDFVKTATAFDHVFTTAVECVPQYRAEYGLASVHALPFATNPQIFNPLDDGPRSDAVIFAGSWYANHVERSEIMHRILDALIASGRGLEIYDRYHGGSDPLHAWPAEYRPYLRPAVSHAETAALYKRSRLGLNINTVTASRTMFARRAFELMSSNTLVISNHSRGLEEMFGDDVVFADRDPGRLAALSSAEIDGMRARNLDLVLARHTYRHRWEEILTAIGFPFVPAAEAVTAIWPVASRAAAEAGLAWFRHAGDPARDRLLLVALPEMPGLEVAALYEDFNRFGATVTALSHAEDLAIAGRYAPVATAHAALVDPESPPPPGWLRRARLHLQYAGERGIVPADGKGALMMRRDAAPWTIPELRL